MGIKLMDLISLAEFKTIVNFMVLTVWCLIVSIFKAYSTINMFLVLFPLQLFMMTSSSKAAGSMGLNV